MVYGERETTRWASSWLTRSLGPTGLTGFSRSFFRTGAAALGKSPGKSHSEFLSQWPSCAWSQYLALNFRSFLPSLLRIYDPILDHGRKVLGLHISVILGLGSHIYSVVNDSGSHMTQKTLRTWDAAWKTAFSLFIILIMQHFVFNTM